MIKRITLWIGLLFLAACTATTAVPEPVAQPAEPVAQILPTKSAALREVVAENETVEANDELEISALDTVPVDEVPTGKRGGAAPSDVKIDPAYMKKLEAELDGAVILYQRSGGLAGVAENWWIHEDGRLTDQDGNVWQLPAAEVKQLLAASEQLGQAKVVGNLVPEGLCCDQFIYSLTVRQADGIYQVVTADGLKTPDMLSKLLATTGKLIEQKTEVTQ